MRSTGQRKCAGHGRDTSIAAMQAVEELPKVEGSSVKIGSRARRTAAVGYKG